MPSLPLQGDASSRAANPVHLDGIVSSRGRNAIGSDYQFDAASVYCGVEAYCLIFSERSILKHRLTVHLRVRNFFFPYVMQLKYCGFAAVIRLLHSKDGRASLNY